MDGATVSVLGLAGTVIGGAVTIAVAVITSRSEKRKTAENALELALRERLLLRDEQIEDLEKRIDALMTQNADLNEAIESRDAVIHARDEYIERLERELSRLRLGQDEARAEERTKTDGSR